MTNASVYNLLPVALAAAVRVDGLFHISAYGAAKWAGNPGPGLAAAEAASWLTATIPTATAGSRTAEMKSLFRGSRGICPPSWGMARTRRLGRFPNLFSAADLSC